MRCILAVALLSPFFATAQLQLAKIFSDNMILQRNEPIHIWGRGVTGQKITVSFANEKRIGVVNADSGWSVYLAKQQANSQAQNIVVSDGFDKIELKNILIGDIWLCIGQSNMEFPMSQEMHYKEALQQSNQPLIRFYNPAFVGKNVFGKSFTDSMAALLTAKDFYRPTDWQTCDSTTFTTMTAVGYYYAKEIVKHENIPVGLIHLAIGGSPIETFISKDALRKSKAFFNKLNGNWLINEALPVWVRERGNQNIGTIQRVAADEMGPNHGYKPGFAFVSGIEPILGLPIKGVIWYQGESNAQEIERVNEYAALQKLMINDYRKQWNRPVMPFYWVQLSSIDTASYKSQLWPVFRNEQRKLVAEIQNGGMAVCSDIGSRNNVHPTNKKAVGERLARWALNKTYKKNIIPSGPLPLQAKYEKDKVVVYFQYCAGGLQTSDGKPIRGFSTDGVTDADAAIKGNEIHMIKRQKPQYIYYGWKPFTDANLMNSESLPASTFKLKVQ
ncbi:MAG: sialate O-acetylesterase [Bacteroidota bacterium]